MIITRCFEIAFILALSAIFHSVSLVNAQAVNPDLIDFTTINNWQDLRTCLHDLFSYFNVDVQGHEHCTTNACLCRPDILGEGVEYVYTEAFSLCSDIQDQTIATSVLLNYCSAKGYTSIIDPTILPTGACATGYPSATVTVTAYVTQYVNQRSSANPAYKPVRPSQVVQIVAAVILFQNLGAQQQTNPSTAPQPGPSTLNTDIASTSPSTKPPSSTLQSQSQTVPASTSSSFSKFVTSSISNVPPPTTSVPVPTSTNSTGSYPNNFTTPEIVGTIIGVLALVATITSVFTTWKRPEPNRPRELYWRYGAGESVFGHR